MAGTWIIMKHDLQTSPEVRRITRKTGAESVHTTIGRLHAAWSWADIHSDDGAMDMGPDDLDDITGCNGFAEAMESVGWLEIDDDSITFPNFGDHNGKTGKRRAKDAARKGSERARRGSETRVSAKCPQNVRNDADKTRNTTQHNTTQNTTAPPTPSPSPETQLENAAAVGVGILTLESWERIGRNAGLDRDLAGQCADTISRAGIQDTETGYVALERLAEAVKGQSVKTPIGLLKTILASQGVPEPAQRTIARRRRSAARRTDLVKSSRDWPGDWRDSVYRRALDAVPDGARPAIPETPPPEWAELPVAMLDFVAANYEEITKPMLEKTA